jgi:hypothetical protein
MYRNKFFFFLICISSDLHSKTPAPRVLESVQAAENMTGVRRGPATRVRMSREGKVRCQVVRKDRVAQAPGLALTAAAQRIRRREAEGGEVPDRLLLRCTGRQWTNALRPSLRAVLGEPNWTAPSLVAVVSQGQVL